MALGEGLQPIQSYDVENITCSYPALGSEVVCQPEQLDGFL